ncbi:TetR/AcrR family transcriptional regulator [Nesterenkonia sp. NBAIMH1]|uniref:TetR/AcrR family transcriptional regulator n=1 Tax=Nesterenkonia sp. NBAIMH1 TaxID=2600320 RepID=UPI0011B6D9F6|nr:TetR/AcrR family transcriptional regulator [Nesterenkonia sp. NBAIMH1]
MVHGNERLRDAERTRAEVLAVATGVFAEMGYSGARVDEIADRTRTTKRMIYYYFGGKEQLYLAVLENAYRGIRQAEQSLDVGDLPPADALRRLAHLTFDHHLENVDFVRLVAIENIHRGESIRKIKAVQEMGRPAVALLEEIIGRGHREKVFRENVTALDTHLLISSYCVFQIANQHTFSHLFDADFASPERRSQMRSLIGDAVLAWARL